LAGVAAARAHLPQLERAPEEPAQLVAERGHARLGLAAHHELIALACGQAVAGGVAHRARRAGVGAVGAEEAPAEIDAQSPVGAQRVGGAGFDAGAAAVLALALVEERRAAEAIGQLGLDVGERVGAEALLPASTEDSPHGRALLRYR